MPALLPLFTLKFLLLRNVIKPVEEFLPAKRRLGQVLRLEFRDSLDYARRSLPLVAVHVAVLRPALDFPSARSCANLSHLGLARIGMKA